MKAQKTFIQLADRTNLLDKKELDIKRTRNKRTRNKKNSQ